MDSPSAYPRGLKGLQAIIGPAVVTVNHITSHYRNTLRRYRFRIRASQFRLDSIKLALPCRSLNTFATNVMPALRSWCGAPTSPSVPPVTARSWSRSSRSFPRPFRILPGPHRGRWAAAVAEAPAACPVRATTERPLCRQGSSKCVKLRSFFVPRL